jgi:hypothetical protein
MTSEWEIPRSSTGAPPPRPHPGREHLQRSQPAALSSAENAFGAARRAVPAYQSGGWRREGDGIAPAPAAPP